MFLKQHKIIRELLKKMCDYEKGEDTAIVTDCFEAASESVVQERTTARDSTWEAWWLACRALDRINKIVQSKSRM